MEEASVVAKIPASICAAMLAILLLAPRAGAQSVWAEGCAGVPTATDGSLTWTPTLCQEFDGSPGPPDTSAWSFDLGGGGWGNNELETYCGPPGYPGNPSQCPSTFSTATANSYLDGNGHLIIQVMNNGGSWYSARMKTQDTQSFLYGRIEASIEIPNTSNPGLWPAFWWLGTNYPTVPWPNCGEADILENWAPAVLGGPGPLQNRSTIHTALTGGSGITSMYNFPSGQQADTAFYAYGVIWSANMLQFYVNPTAPQVAPLKPFFIVTASDLQSGDTWPFNNSAFLLANVAVGGTLGGSTTNTVSPQTMTIDYVRQYKPSAVPAPALGQPAGITVTAGATTGNTTIITPAHALGTGYVYFSCTTNAPKSTCSINTNDPVNHFVTNAGASTPETLTLTVVTTTNAGALRFFASPQKFCGILVGGASILLLLAALRDWRTSHVRRELLCGIAFGCLLGACLTLLGCGGGNGGGGGGQGGGSSSAIGTTPGDYTVTVFAFTESNMSDGATSNADASVEIPLTVD